MTLIGNRAQHVQRITQYSNLTSDDCTIEYVVSYENVIQICDCSMQSVLAAGNRFFSALLTNICACVLIAISRANLQIESTIKISKPKFFLSGFSTTKPPSCMASLGLEKNEIPDSAITASSENSHYPASQGRLYKQGSWIAATNDMKQWFQVDFVNWSKVTGVAIQGCAYWDEWWVTKFKLAYSYDGVFFSDYREDGDNTKVLF